MLRARCHLFNDVISLRFVPLPVIMQRLPDEDHFVVIAAWGQPRQLLSCCFVSHRLRLRRREYSLQKILAPFASVTSTVCYLRVLAYASST